MLYRMSSRSKNRLVVAGLVFTITGCFMSVLTFLNFSARSMPSNWWQAAAWGVVALTGLYMLAAWALDWLKTWVKNSLESAKADLLKTIETTKTEVLTALERRIAEEATLRNRYDSTYAEQATGACNDIRHDLEALRARIEQVEARLK